MADSSHDAPERKPISRRLRFEILRRDGHQCRYCGAGADEAKLTVDHVIPVALGGTNDPSNLVAACKDCNAGKTSTSPDEHVVADADDRAVAWARALELAAERRRADIHQAQAVVDAFDTAWCSWTDGYSQAVDRDPRWRTSIDTFVAAGLNLDDLVHFVDVAMRSKASHNSKWRYFCGCCWKEVNRRQEIALDIVGGATPGDDEISEAAIEEAEQAAYDDGFNDGYLEGKRVQVLTDDEDSRVSYEEGFRFGCERTIERWRREHPEDFVVGEVEFGATE